MLDQSAATYSAYYEVWRVVLVDSVASWGRRAVETTSAALSPAVTSAATQDSSAPVLMVVHPRLTKLPLPMRPSRREAVGVGSMVYHIRRKKHGLPYQLDGRNMVYHVN